MKDIKTYPEDTPKERRWDPKARHLLQPLICLYWSLHDISIAYQTYLRISSFLNPYLTGLAYFDYKMCCWLRHCQTPNTYGIFMSILTCQEAGRHLIVSELKVINPRCRHYCWTTCQVIKPFYFFGCLVQSSV